MKIKKLAKICSWKTTKFVTKIIYLEQSQIQKACYLIGKCPVLCLGQDLWGTHVSLYLNFRGTFTNSGGHTNSFKFLPVKLSSYPEISVHFLFKFELNY